jgi:transposase InsO family protein
MSLSLPANKEWLTASEAAAEQLPGYAFSERQIQRFLRENTIPTRPRAGRGGGREFSYRDLPEEAQAEYLKRYGRATTALATDDKPTRATEKKLQAQARAAIVDAAEALIARKGSVGVALKTLAKLYSARKAGVMPWVYENQASADPDQVRTWRRKLQREGLDGLLDGRGKSGRPNSIEADPELRNLIIAEIVARGHLAIASTKDDDDSGLQGLIRRRLGREIPVRTLQRYVATLRPETNALVQSMVKPGAFLNSHKGAIGSYSQGIVRPNQKWEMDATRGDVMCIVTLPDGSTKMSRCALTQIIDVATRRCIIVVSDQPSGAATRAAMRKAIIRFGIPELIKTDNGKEFKNYEVERMCRELGITLEFCRPFRPWEKPHVESMFGTLMECLFEKLNGYVGHDITERKEIENKRSFEHKFGVDRRVLFDVQMSPADVQATVDAWLEDKYEQAFHLALGMTPDQKAKALAQTDEIKFVRDERLLDVLMMNGKVCKVSKGLIRYKNRYYGSEQTQAIEVTPRFHQRVQLRVDPLDPSWAAVYSPDGEEFLCIAKDVALLEASERQRMAVIAAKNQDNVISMFHRAVRAVGPTQDIIGSLLASEVPGPALTGPGAEGMIRAAAPRIEKHQKVLTARADIDKPPAPIEPTAEDYAAAARFTEQTAIEPARVRMIDCNGYRRPAFEDDVDLIFWWEDFEADGGRIDDEDRDRRKELYADALFCERLAVARRNRTSRLSTGVG